MEFPYKLFDYQNGILLNETTIDLYLCKHIYCEEINMN